ncbi:hypothetical protein L1887_42094 [Cichorium endivia]|nr:hypothetical protein L1887_42094 [Cichorium endivia]
MSGSRRSILAGINTTTNALSSPSSANNADNDRDPQDPSPIPLSHTDALLRSRGNAASDAASLKHSPSVASRKSRSGSIASRKNPQTPASPTRSPSVNGNATHDGYLAPSSASVGRSRGFSAQASASGRAAPTSPRAMRAPSTPVAAPRATAFRIRRFSSASRKMSIKMPALATRSKLRLHPRRPLRRARTALPRPPVPSLPAAYPTNGAVDGYKALGASPAPLNTTSGSIRSPQVLPLRQPGRGHPQERIPRPRHRRRPLRPRQTASSRSARSKRASSASAAPARARGASEPPLGTTATDDTSCTQGASSPPPPPRPRVAAAGAAGAAGSLFGLARRKSSRSLKSADAEQDAPRQNGMAAAAAADSDDAAQSDSASDEERRRATPTTTSTTRPLADISEGEEEEDSHHGHHAAEAGGAAAALAVVAPAPPHVTVVTSPRAPPVPPVAQARKATAPTTVNDTRARSDTSQAVRDKGGARRQAHRQRRQDHAPASCATTSRWLATRSTSSFNSRMIEAERIIEEYARLAPLLCARLRAHRHHQGGFMTFEPADLAIAISLCKDALTIANLLRKPSSAVSNFGRFRPRHRSVAQRARPDGRGAAARRARLRRGRAAQGRPRHRLRRATCFAFVSEGAQHAQRLRHLPLPPKVRRLVDEKGQNLDEDFKSGVYLGNGPSSA